MAETATHPADRIPWVKRRIADLEIEMRDQHLIFAREVFKGTPRAKARRIAGYKDKSADSSATGSSTLINTTKVGEWLDLMRELQGYAAQDDRDAWMASAWLEAKGKHEDGSTPAARVSALRLIGENHGWVKNERDADQMQIDEMGYVELEQMLIQMGWTPPKGKTIEHKKEE